MLLSHLKELRILVISSISAVWAGYPTAAALCPQSFGSLFESCEKLKQIHFSVDLENYQTFRWIAGSLDIESMFTPIEEFHRWWNI